MKHIFCALAVVAVVLAGCGTGNPNDQFDWCYTFDFTESQSGVVLTNGAWVWGQGLTPFEDGTLIATYTHDTFVEPVLVGVTVERQPDSPLIDIFVDATIFGVDVDIDQAWPADYPDANTDTMTLYFAPQNANVSTRTMELNLSASHHIAIKSVQIRGRYASPFTTNNCSDLVTGTPTGTPVTNTPTPSYTPTASYTPTETLTPTATFTPSATPTCQAGSPWNIWWPYAPGTGQPPLPDPSTQDGTIDIIEGEFTPTQSSNSFTRGITDIVNPGTAVSEIEWTFDSPTWLTSYEMQVTAATNSIANAAYYVYLDGLLVTTGVPARAGLDNWLVSQSITPGYYSKMKIRVEQTNTPGNYAFTSIARVRVISTCISTYTPVPSQTPSVTRTPVTRTPGPTASPSRTPVIVGSPTPATPQHCSGYEINFDDPNELPISFPYSQYGQGNAVITTNGYSGRGLRFRTTHTGEQWNNQRAFLITTDPTWFIQELTFRYRYSRGGSDLGSSRWLWADRGTGAQSVGGPFDIELPYPDTWQRMTVRFDGTGYYGVGMEFNIRRDSFSYIDIDDIVLCVVGPRPTLDVTPTYVTAVPSATLVPFPTLLPTQIPVPGPGEGDPWGTVTDCAASIEVENDFLGVGTFLARFWNCVLLPPILNIQDAIAGLFNWIVNVGRGFFDWLGSLFRWAGGALTNLLISIRNFAEGFLSFLHLIGRVARQVIDIIGLLIAIIRHLLDLFAGWISQFFELIQTILYDWYLTTPRPIPYLPQCLTAPMTSDVCAVYYILENTLLAGTVGSLIIPFAVIAIDLAILLRFIITVRNLIKKGEGVTGGASS